MTMTKFIKSKNITNKGVYALLLVMFFSCATLEEQKYKNISTIKLLSKIPIIKLTGELEYIADSIFITSINDTEIYHLPYLYAVDIDNQIKSKSTMYSYFFYKIGKTKGVFYESLEDNIGDSLSVDSLQTDRAFMGIKFYNNITDTLVETINSKSKYLLIEKYIPNKKIDDSYADTVIYYYGRKDDSINYIFCKELEKEKNMKIYKIDLVYNQSYNIQYQKILPKRKFIFELEKTNFRDSVILRDFILKKPK